MPSKSQLTGQSDIWDLSDYFPPGEPWESSFNWYKDSYNLTSVPYSYYFSDSYAVGQESIENIKVNNLEQTLVESYSFISSIEFIEVRDVLKTYQFFDLPYTFTGEIISISVRDNLHTYSYREFYTLTPHVENIVIKNAIQYSYQELYTFTPSIQGVTIT